MKVFDEYERGYLEASIDDEGTISLYAHPRGGRLYCDPAFSFTSTNLDLVERVREILGEGRITPSIRKQRQKGGGYLVWKTSYILRVCKRESIRQILSQLRLVAKEEQRRLLLHALDLLDERRSEWRDKVLYSITRRMAVLNERVPPKFVAEIMTEIKEEEVSL